MILSGSAHPKLASQLAQLTNFPLGKVSISKFPNGEKRVWVRQKLAGKVVIIVQPFSDPVDEHIIEFCLLVDAAHHLKAKKIIGVVPWLGYSPQDKLFRQGEPISVHVIAKLIEAVNLSRLIIADIHSESALTNFSIPVTHISTIQIFINHFKSKNLNNHIAVALDKGATQRVKKFAAVLRLPMAQFEKTRDRRSGQIKFETLKGDVKDKHIISFDDFVSTGATRIQASKILKQKGAKSYTDCITHALLADDSPSQLQQSAIDKLIATDSYPIPKTKRFPKLKIMPIAPLISQALNKLV